MLLYLMVLIESHTISKSIDNDYKVNDNIFDSINEVDHSSPKTRREKFQHRYKPYYSKDDDVATTDFKDIKPFTILERPTEKILTTTSPKTTTEFGKHHKSSKRRVADFWRKLRGKDKKKECNKHVIDIDRKKRIPNKKEPYKKDNLNKNDFRNRASIKGKKKNRRKTLRQHEAKVTKRDVVGQYLLSTRPYLSPQSFKSRIAKSPQIDKMLRRKFKIRKIDSREDKEKTLGEDFVNLSDQLDNITFNLSNLKARYGVLKTMMPIVEFPSFLDRGSYTLVASSTPSVFTSSTTIRPTYQGTALIEHMLNDLKSKSVYMDSGQTPSLTSIISSAATTATFDAYPILRRVGGTSPGSNIFKGVTIPQPPQYNLSTFITINENANDNVIKTTVDSTESDKLSLHDPLFNTNKKSHNLAARSIKEDTMTIAQNVEDMLQRELKNIYNKVKHKVSSDFRKEVHDTKTTIKEGYSKFLNKSTTKHPSNSTKATCPCKSVTPKNNIKATTTSPRVKKKDTQSEASAIKDTAETPSSAKTPDDDYMMLNVYEQMLAKTNENQMKNMVATTELPIFSKTKREAFRLSKRNPETLTNVELNEVVQNLYDDGVNMPEYDYIEPSTNISTTIKNSANNNSNSYNDVDYFEKSSTMENKAQGSMNDSVENNANTKGQDPQSTEANNISFLDSTYGVYSSTAKDNSLEGLSKKISFNQYVDGYRHYLKFQKDQGNQNFSNLVKYQAHRHHSVDSIGKYILDKIPPVPSSYKKRLLKKRFSDDSENNNMDYQEITTKSEDSWFRKHFYLFLDNGPPKKYHTSQTVELKSPLKQKLFMTEPPKVSEIPEQQYSDGAAARKSKMSPKICLDDLSKILDDIKNKQTSALEAELKTQTNLFMPYSVADDSIQSKSFIGKLFSGKRRRDDRKETTTTYFGMSDYMFPENIPEKQKRSITKDDFNNKNTMVDEFIKNIEEKVTTFSPNHIKEVLADVTQSKIKDNNKYGYVDIDVVPRPTAVVKLRENAKKSRFKNFFKKFHFKKKKKTTLKPKRSCYYENFSENSRRVRFNPIKKLKSILFSNEDKDKEEDGGIAIKFQMPDYEVVSNPAVEEGVFKNMKPLSLDDMKKQIPNISDVYFEPDHTTKASSKLISSPYKLDDRDHDLLYNHKSKTKGVATKGKAKGKHTPTTKTLAITLASNSIDTPTVLKKKQTPSRNLMTVNVKMMEPVKTTEPKSIVTSAATENTFPTETSSTTETTVEDIKLSLNNMNYMQKKGADNIPINNMPHTIKQGIVDIPKKTTAPIHESEQVTAKCKKQVIKAPLLINDQDEGVIVKSKLTRVAKFPIRKRHYETRNKVRSEPVNEERSFGDEFKEYFRDLKNTITPPNKKKTAKVLQGKIISPKPIKLSDNKNKYTDYFNDLVLWHNDILNLDTVPNPLWKEIVNTIDAAQVETPTTPNMTILLMELDEVKDQISDGPLVITSTTDFKDLLAKDQIVKRDYKIDKDPEIQSVAMDDNTLVNSKDMIIKGEVKYFQYNNPEPRVPQLKSSDFITKLDNLNVLRDEDVEGKDRARHSTHTFENNFEPVISLDTTLMAFDDEVDFIKSLNGKEMSMLLQKSRKSVPTTKINDHTTILKTNKAPMQHYTTPLPMAAHDFNKFLKDNSMDVEYVTSPILELPTIEDLLVTQRPASLVKTTYVRSVSPTAKPNTTKKQNAFTKQLSKFTKALSRHIFKPNNITSKEKKAFWEEDIDRFKRYTDLSKTFINDGEKRYTVPQADNYYSILKKKMKEKLFEKKQTASVERGSKATLAPDSHKEVEITIINFDDIEKMTPHQAFGSSYFFPRKEEPLAFKDYPEISVDPSRKHDPTMKLNKGDMHNELLYKDVYKERTISSYAASSSHTSELPQTTENYDSIFNEGPASPSDNNAKYSYEHKPTYPNIFNKMSHADVPKRVHISSHHYKYDIFYDDQGVKKKPQNGKNVADTLSQAASNRNPTIFDEKITKEVPITHKLIPTIRKADSTNKNRKRFCFRGCISKSYDRLIHPRRNFESQSPSSQDSTTELSQNWHEDPTLNLTRMSELFHKDPGKLLLDNATEMFGNWQRDPISTTVGNTNPASETLYQNPTSTVDEASEIPETWQKDTYSSAKSTYPVSDTILSAAYNPTELPEIWQKDTTLENTNSASEKLHQDLMSTTMVKPVEPLEIWEKDTTSSTVKNTKLASGMHKDTLSVAGNNLPKSWPKDAISSTLKYFPGVTGTRPKDFKSDAQRMVATIDELELGEAMPGDVDLGTSPSLQHSPFFTMITIKNNESLTRSLPPPASTVQPDLLVNEVRLLKRTVGSHRPSNNEEKQHGGPKKERNRRLFRISALIPNRFKGLMRNVTTTTKGTKTNSTKTQHTKATTQHTKTTTQYTKTTTQGLKAETKSSEWSAYDLTPQKVSKGHAAKDAEKLAETAVKLAQKSEQTKKVPVKVTEETDEPTSDTKEIYLNVEKAQDIDEQKPENKGDGFHLSYHPKTGTVTNEAIAPRVRFPPHNTFSPLDITVMDEEKEEKQLKPQHTGHKQHDKIFRCKGKVINNSGNDVIFIEPPCYNEQLYTPLILPPTLATKSTTTTEDFEYRLEHSEVKREARDQDIFTAKDVAALEVVVDLMKNTLNYEESNSANVSSNSNITVPFAPKPLHNSNGSTNSIQVHIAIPFDFQKVMKRSDRAMLNPIRVRKVFSAKMSSPVDLEYQVHSFEGTIQPTSSKISTISNLNKPKTDLTPGMYLLIDKPKNGYALKAVVGHLNYSDINTRQAGTRTTVSMASLKSTENREETTSMKSLGKVTLSKDFIAAVNQKLIEMYENMSRNQDSNVNKRSERSIWSRKQKTEEKKRSAEKYINTRHIDWDTVKKYFGHDRVCNCKCKVNQTMCNICAASDAVIDELIFEFDNIGKYMADHCTEIQTFFWMNPIAGQKLRDSVNKIDKSLTDYYKRVKGKCQGKLCKTYGACVDRKRFTKTNKVEKGDAVSQLINDMAVLAEDINKTVSLNVCYNNKFKEKGDQFLNLMNHCIMKKSFSKRSNPSTPTTKKLIKNVYSLDNINVNIICNSEVEPKTELPTLALPYIKENSSRLYDDIVDYEYQKIKRKGLKKLLPRKSKLFSFGKSPKINFKRQVSDQMEKPLISDSGGEFWYEYLKTGPNDLRLPRDSVKGKSNIEIKVVEKHGDEQTAVVQNVTARPNVNVNTDMINVTVKTTPETNLHVVETSTDNLIKSIDRLLWLLSSMPDVETINKNSNLHEMIYNNITENHKKEPEEFVDDKINANTSSLVNQDEPDIYTSGSNIYATIAATIAGATLSPSKSFLDQKLAEISTIEQSLDLATKVVTTLTTKHKATPLTNITSIVGGNTVVITTKKPAYSSSTKSILVQSKLTTKTALHDSKSPTKAVLHASTPLIKTVNVASETVTTTSTSKLTTKPVPTSKNTTLFSKTSTPAVSTEKTTSAHTANPSTLTESTTDFITTKTFKTSLMHRLKAATLKFFNRGKDPHATRYKTEISTSTVLNAGLTPAVIDLIAPDSNDVEIDYVEEQLPQSTTQKSTVVNFNNYDDQFSSDRTDFSKEGYKSLLLSIIQFETNNLNDEWDVVAYGGDKKRIDADFKRSVMNLSKHKTTKPPQPPQSNSMIIGGDYEIPVQDKTTKKKPEGLLNKIASKMGLKIIPTKKKVANKQSVREVKHAEKFINSGKMLQFSNLQRTMTTTRPTTEACDPRPKPEGRQMCDMQATFDHIQHLQTTLPPKTFEKFVKNISCHKFKDVDSSFIIPYKRKGKRWDWIRNKRTPKLHFYRIEPNFDDEAGVEGLDELSVDSFERFAKGDDGIYKIINRWKRTANLEALDRGLRNIPPLIPGENELYVIVGDSVTLNCGHSAPVRTCDGKFLWRTDRPEMLEQDNVDVRGFSLTINNVKARNTGRYTCNLDHSVRRNIKLSVVAIPSFDIVFLPVYKTARNCSYDDLVAIQRLGGLMANEIHCGKVCSIRIDEPVCQRDRGINSTLVKATAVMSVTPRELNCSLQCRRDVIASLFMLGATNTAALSSIGVVVSQDGVNQTLTPWTKQTRPVVTHSLRKKDTNGHHEYHKLVSALSPGKVDVVIICPAGYYLLPEYKLCSSCPPNTSSKAGDNRCRVCPRGLRAQPGAAACHANNDLQRRYDWWWYPPGGYLVACCGIMCGCSACVMLSVIVHLISRDPGPQEHQDCAGEQTSPKTQRNVAVAYAHIARTRPLSPSRVILPRFFRPSLTSSRATDSQETKFELWKERNIAPPLPPIDFDP